MNIKHITLVAYRTEGDENGSGNEVRSSDEAGLDLTILRSQPVPRPRVGHSTYFTTPAPQ